MLDFVVGSMGGLTSSDPSAELLTASLTAECPDRYCMILSAKNPTLTRYKDAILSRQRDSLKRMGAKGRVEQRPCMVTKGKRLLPAPDWRSLVSEVLIIRYFPEVESLMIQYIERPSTVWLINSRC